MCNNFKENDVYNCYICNSDCFRLFWLSKETLKKKQWFIYLPFIAKKRHYFTSKDGVHFYF